MQLVEEAIHSVGHSGGVARDQEIRKLNEAANIAAKARISTKARVVKAIFNKK